MNQLSIENYLKQIYASQSTFHNFVKVKEIAERLHVTPASVTEMIKKLAEQNYISYVPYRGVKLTEKGLKKALETIRRHRLWESYLYKKIGLSIQEVHQEAEKLEHASSESLINRLDTLLQYPHYDPHGSPIPSQEEIEAILPHN